MSHHIDDDPGGKAHDKAQSAPQHARSPKLPLVMPDPEPQHDQEGEPVDIGEPEPEPRDKSQERGKRRRARLIGKHFEEEKQGQCGKHDRF